MKYIVLLRGINVSGKHKIIMKNFVDILLQNPKLTTVKSYIQSGNFVVESSLKKTAEINDLFSTIILDHYQYNISTISYSIDEFKNILNYYPFTVEDKKNYITFLADVPLIEKTANLISKTNTNDEYKIDQNIIYIKYANKYSDSKLNNNFFEKQLNILATTRNIKTVNKILEIADK